MLRIHTWQRASRGMSAPILTCVTQAPMAKGKAEAAATRAKAGAVGGLPLRGVSRGYAGHICVENVARQRNTVTSTTLLLAVSTRKGRAPEARGVLSRTFALPLQPAVRIHRSRGRPRAMVALARHKATRTLVCHLFVREALVFSLLGWFASNKD